MEAAWQWGRGPGPGREGRTENSVMVEAEQVIQRWLQGVEKSGGEEKSRGPGPQSPDYHMPRAPAYTWGDNLPSAATQYPHGLRRGEHIDTGPYGLGGWTSELTPTEGTTPLPHAGHSNQADVLTGLDWSEGDVRDNARAVVDRLMKKSFSGRKGSHDLKKRSRDPLVTMEMRHKAVKERRQAKERVRSHALQSQLTKREARREAELVVRREEETRRSREVREEGMIREQMAAIRKQLKEETDRQRVLESHLSSVGAADVLPPPPLLDSSDREAVMRFAGECVREGEQERRRVETRVELVRQLAEAEAAEEKEILRLLHKYFTTWYSAVAQERAKLGKATAVREWRMMVRVWRGWRGVVTRGKARREKEAIAREMQREKRFIDLAVCHYHRRLMLRCLCAWLYMVRMSRGQREEEREGERKREKMAAFLQAVVEGKVGDKGCHTDQPNLREEETKMASMAERRRRNGGPSEEGARVVNKGPPDPIIWQAARQQLDQLMLEGAEEMDRREGSVRQCPGEPTDRVHVAMKDGRQEEGGQSTATGPPRAVSPPRERVTSGRDRPTVRKAPPKPPTKPATMTRMEARSAEIAQRRSAREARRTQQEAERLAEMERREAERRRVEKESKEELAAKRKEERRLAKQQEEERQERLRKVTELMARSKGHYRQVLLRNRGLVPWQRFMFAVREEWVRAEESDRLRLLRQAFLPWREARRVRERRREEIATDHYHFVLVRRVMQAWREYISYCHSLDEVASCHCQWLTVHRAFQGWEEVVRTERVREWEGGRRAKTFYQRAIKRRALRAWVRFVPLTKEERIREGRREELRRKVTAWLPDYQPVEMQEGT